MDEYIPKNGITLGHEPIEANVRAVWRTAAVLVGVVIASYFLVIGIMKWFAATEGGPPAIQAAKTDRDWDEQDALQHLRIRERQMLDEYAWVDRSTGMARVPVDRAIALVAEHGLPTALQPTANPGTTWPQQRAGSETTPASELGTAP